MNFQLLHCPNCDSELKEGINFCPKCGSGVKELITNELSNTIVTETSETETSENNTSINEKEEIIFNIEFEILKCKNCGTELQDNINFCPNCGGNIRIESDLSGKDNSRTDLSGKDLSKTSKTGLSGKNLSRKVVKFTFSFLFIFLLGCGVGYFFDQDIDNSFKTFGIIKDKTGNMDGQNSNIPDIDNMNDNANIGENNAQNIDDGNKDNQSQDTITLAKTDTPESTEEGTTEGVAFHSLRPSGEVIKLGEYKDVVVDVEAPAVTEEEIEEEIYNLLSIYANYVTVTDREDVRNGDIVNINYVGTIDGQEFYGGSEESHYGTDIVIGSHSFIEGFDEQLVGGMVGETTIVSITFSEDSEYAGKEAVFTVTINFIREEQLPEFTDEFVLEKRGFLTVDEYIASLKEMLLEEKKEAILASASFQVMKNIMDETVMIGISSDEITRYCNTQMKIYESYATALGMDIEEFCMEFFSESYEKLYKEMLIYAEDAIKQNLILFTIADLEGVSISEEEYMAGGESYAWLNNYDSLEEMLHFCTKEEIMEYMLIEKVHKLITDCIIINYIY